MTYTPNEPAGSRSLASSDDILRANQAQIATAINVLGAFTTGDYSGEPRAGASRVYFDDYDDPADLPTPTTGYEAGRLAFNNSANMAGQGWYHNGTVWVPLASTRITTTSDDSAVQVNPNGSYVNFDDAGLGQTVTMAAAGYWTYECIFDGSFTVNNAANDQLFVQIWDDTNNVAIAHGTFTTPGATLNPTVVHFHLSGTYNPAAAGAVTLAIRVKATVNAASGVARASDGADVLPHTLIVREIPA